MPSDMPGTLSDDDAVALASILIVGEDGPGPVPNFSLVRVVGCLTAGPDGDWILTQGTEPERARNGESSLAEAETMAAVPLGTRTFGLMDVSYLEPEGRSKIRRCL